MQFFVALPAHEKPPESRCHVCFPGFQIAAEGFEPSSVLIGESDQTEKVALPVAHKENNTRDLRSQVFADLKRAVKSLSGIEATSDDRIEAAKAERARAFVNRAILEIEDGVS